MTITLTPELEQLVTRRVRTGQYSTPSEVVDRGLRLLEQEEALNEARLQHLKREIALGIEQADRGQTKPFDPDDLLRRVRQQMAEG